MTPFYHPTFGIKFYPPGSQPPAGWYRTGLEAERMRHVDVPALLLAPVLAPQTTENVVDEWPDLVKRAEAAGLRIDGRWKIKRLKREVAKAEK